MDYALFMKYIQDKSPDKTFLCDNVDVAVAVFMLASVWESSE